MSINSQGNNINKTILNKELKAKECLTNSSQIWSNYDPQLGNINLIHKHTHTQTDHKPIFITEHLSHIQDIDTARH